MRVYYGTPEELAKDEEVRRFSLKTLQDIQFTSASQVGAEGVASAWVASAPEHLWFLTVNLLTRYCYVVTAGHEHAGTVPVYAQDVSFTAFRWPKGECCGTKQTAVTSATLMAFTATPMPQLMADPGSDGDWTHLFVGPVTVNGQRVGEAGVVPSGATKAFADFQDGLRQLSKECDEFNDRALGEGEFAGKGGEFPNCFGMWQTNPKYLETAVSV